MSNKMLRSLVSTNTANRLTANHELLVTAVAVKTLWPTSGRYCYSTQSLSPNDKYTNFERYVNREKRMANRYLLLEDKCQALAKLNVQTLSKLLDTKVNRIHKWCFNQSQCALVELQDINYRLRRDITRQFGYDNEGGGGYDRRRSPQPPPNTTNYLKFISLNKCPKLVTNTGHNRSSNTDNKIISGISSSSSSSSSGGGGSDPEVLREMTSRRKDTYHLNINYLRQTFKTNKELLSYLVADKQFDDLDLKLRFYIISQLEQYICQSFYQSYQILPFGSSIAGLGTPNSDLDLVLVPKVLPNGQMSEREEDREKLKSSLNLIADLLQYSVPFYSHFSRILRARIPIIKFGFDLAPIDIDLSVELSAHAVHSGLYMSAFLDYCNQLNPCVRGLILLLRVWAKQHNLLKPKNWSTTQVYMGFTSFQLTSLVIYYLQKRQILPPMKQFLDHSSQLFVPNPTANQSSIDLLKDFFKFVLSLRFNSDAISILNGNTYANPRPSGPIWMQNPFETHLNMCRNINTPKFEKFLGVCHLSYEMMKSNDFYLLDIMDKDLVFSPLNKVSNNGNYSRIIVEDLFD